MASLKTFLKRKPRPIRHRSRESDSVRLGRTQHRWKRSSVRAIRAATVIVCVFCVLAFEAAFAPAPQKPSVTGSEKRLSESVVEGIRAGRDDFFPETALPSWFEEEFFSAADYFDFHCDDSQAVIGLRSAKPIQAVRDSIRQAMESKGWTALSSGTPTLMTMVRKEGAHSWALIWCEAVGGQSTIVIQTLPNPSYASQ